MVKVLNLIDEAKKLIPWKPAECLLSLNNIQIRLGRYTPGHQPVDELHHVDEFLSLVSGEVEVEAAGVRYPMNKDDYLIVPAGTAHCVHVIKEAVMLVVRLMPS